MTARRAVLLAFLLLAGCGGPGLAPQDETEGYAPALRELYSGDHDEARDDADAAHAASRDPLRSYKRMWIHREAARREGAPRDGFTRGPPENRR